MAKKTNTSAGPKAPARTGKAAPASTAPAPAAETKAKSAATKAAAPSAKASETKKPAVAPAKAKRAAPSKAPAESVVAKATRGAKAAVETVTAPVAKAAKGTTRAAGSARKSAARLVPEAPSFPSGDVGQFVKSMGNQIVGALNTDVGRVMVAELLVHVAKSLTKAAANTETGKDAKDALVNAGAKIGAAAASAGAKFVETGAAAASSGTDAAAGAADGAKTLAREVAQVAVSAVGGVVAEAAAKVIKGRKSEPAKPQPAPGGTPRPPQL